MRALKSPWCVVGLPLLGLGAAQAAEPSPRFAVAATFEPSTTAEPAVSFALETRLRPIEPASVQRRYSLRAALAAPHRAKAAEPACAVPVNSIFIDGFETGVTQ